MSSKHSALGAMANLLHCAERPVKSPADRPWPEIEPQSVGHHREVFHEIRGVPHKVRSGRIVEQPNCRPDLRHGHFTATVVGPTQLRLVLVDVIDAPATWEVDSDDTFNFASGTFAGPYAGDVVFE